MTHVSDIDQQIREQQEQQRAARILLEEREQAKQAPEKAYAAAQANLAKLEQQRAETLFNEALEQNNQYLAANQDAIKRLHDAMAARPLDFDKVRALADYVQDTFERQQQHARRAVDNMQNRVPASPNGVPAWMPLRAKFTPAIDKGEAAVWFIKGKRDAALMEAQAIVYVLFGVIFNVPDDYDPVAMMRRKINR